MKEIWKEIPGYECLYEVSNMGRVKALSRVIIRSDGVKQTYKESFKKPTLGKRGYYFVTLSKKGVSKKHNIHRLVAINFIPNPKNKSQVNHIDGDKLNNNICNLEWVTNKENSNHALYSGLLDNKGSKNGMSKLSEEDVIFIKSLKNNKKHREIAKQFNVSQSTVTMILNGKRWKHI